MPFKSWKSLKINEDCIKQWLEELNPNTAKDYGFYFLHYRDWFIEHNYWSSAQAMSDEYEKRITTKDRYTHIDVLKEYIKSKETSSNNRRNIWYAVRSFYSFHRLPLPQIPRNESSRLFRLTIQDKRRAMAAKPLKLDEVRLLIQNANHPYKVAFMLIFQTAMGLSEFTRFNVEGWRDIVTRLDEPGPLRIDLYREKTSKTRVDKYYSFVGEDSKRLIKEWLKMRTETDIDALFVVFNKNKQAWVPLRGPLIGNMITKIAKRIGLIKSNELKRYHIHAHEFRDLFKSLCTLNGVNSIASEFFLGHRIDKLGYDKSPEYDVEWFKREYIKVEPQLNIISGSRKVDDMKKEVALEAIRRFAEVFGVDPLKVRIEKQKELGKKLNSEEEIQLIQNEIKRLRQGDDDPQIIVSEEDLESYLKDGWQFVSVLPSQKILIRK